MRGELIYYQSCHVMSCHVIYDRIMRMIWYKKGGTMYGLVNNAFVDYAVSQIGELRWREICGEKDLQQVPYQNMEAYPDQETLALVVAISETLQVSIESCLKNLGEFWIKYVTNSPYSPMITKSGNTMKALMQNLDSLHTRLSLSFNELQAPSFWVSEVSEVEFNLYYLSEREGLNSFVEGLLRGLSNYFGIKIDISVPTQGENGETLWRIKTL